MEFPRMPAFKAEAGIEEVSSSSSSSSLMNLSNSQLLLLILQAFAFIFEPAVGLSDEITGMQYPINAFALVTMEPSGIAFIGRHTSL
jgi:hypothetical protein